MQKIIISFIAILGIWLPQLSPAQGTLYFSNLGEPPVSSMVVGSDAWLTQSFRTGTNSGGYYLNSVQLLMGTTTGNPNGFSVAIYNHTPGDIRFPGSYLSSLSGPDPAAGGTFSYNSIGVVLLPSTSYFVVLTAATPVSNGTYSWSATSSFNADSSDGWGGTGFHFSSADGVAWGRIAGPFFQFGVNATAVPEPSISAIVALGLAALGFLRCRK